MYSKIATLIALALSVSACSLRFGETPKAQSEIQLAVSETQCLHGGTKVLTAIMEGRASDEEIAGLWNCAARSLQVFKDRTRGSIPGVYRPEELREFLERYFLKGTKISDALLEQFMKLKCTLLGGQVNALTKDELSAAIQLLGILRDQNLKLRPFFPLTAEHFSQVDAGTLDAAVSTIDGAAVALSDVLRGTGYDYHLQDLVTLLKELEAAASSPAVVNGLRNLRAFLPAFSQFKAVLVSPDPNKITSQEWETLFTTMNRWYGLYLRYSYARHQDSSWVHGVGRAGLVDVAKDVVEELEKAVSRRTDKLIPFAELDSLIDSLDPKLFSLGSLSISPDHLKAFLRPLVQRVLAGARPGSDGRDAMGLTVAGLNHGWELLDDWSEGQRFLDLLFEKWGDAMHSGDSSGNPTNLLRSQLLFYSIEDVFGVPKSEIRQVTWEAATRLRHLIQTQRPFFKGDDAEVTFDALAQDPTFSYNTLTQLNYQDVLARLFVQSYAEDPARVNVGVTLDELKTMFLDIRDLGLDLHVFDPSNPKVYVSRFTEANLFLPSSNGDDLLSVDETQQLLAYMVSAKHASNRAQKAIDATCNRGIQPPLDFFGNNTIEASCYRREFFANIDKNWDHLPLLRAYYHALSDDERAVFQRNFEVAARKVGFSDQRFESPDSEGFAGVAHYLESLMSRFDRDRSGTISKEEALEGNDPAFGIFRNLLGKASCSVGSCLSSEGSLETLFTYLLAHGHVPSKGEYVWWWLQRPFWNFEADRGRIIDIMAELAQSIRSAGTKAAVMTKITK